MAITTGTYQKKLITLCCFFFLLLFLCSCCCCAGAVSVNSFPVSNVGYAKTRLEPYEWRYLRVELPLWFSAMNINVETDVAIIKESVGNLTDPRHPIICFRNGSPPLPDVSGTPLKDLVLGTLTNSSIGDMQVLPRVEQCHLLQGKIILSLTNEQISPGVWYIGLFNGIGPPRTQSKMINRGPAFSFSANVSVDGCATSTMRGPSCNQTVLSLPCVQSDVYKVNQTQGNIITCRNTLQTPCQNFRESQIYSLDIAGSAQFLKIMLNTPANETGNASINIYARHGIIPTSTLHDYSNDFNENPLIIKSPKVGRWYFVAIASNQSNINVLMQEQNTCYSLEWRIHECPAGKAGPSCTWQTYMLQANPTKDQSTFGYLPISENISTNSPSFRLNSLLTDSLLGNNSDNNWTYFLLDIPRGAAGQIIHVQLNSEPKQKYGIYSRFGGLPSSDLWDYYYESNARSSNGSLFFRIDDSSDKSTRFYILNAQEGIWGLGLRHPTPTGVPLKSETTMLIATERCYRGCSGHGTCKSSLDASGLTIYSYCTCDKNHGGFDCSIEIISQKGHLLQSVTLIGSNAAAILPALITLRQKAFAEWILFTASGISSALYHACDVGAYCALPFGPLQFMDFWLSFVAVVSTFVYLTTFGEATKRVIQTGVTIITALMAITGATRTSNIILVMVIGGAALLIGLAIEFSPSLKSFSCSRQNSLNIHERWLKLKGWLFNLLKTVWNRFRWGFVIAGFGCLGMAALSWHMESSKNYWIWHSMWHISIFTSSFFFLCSKRNALTVDTSEVQNTVYALTRQDSLPRSTV